MSGPSTSRKILQPVVRQECTELEQKVTSKSVASFFIGKLEDKSQKRRYKLTKDELKMQVKEEIKEEKECFLLPCCDTVYCEDTLKAEVKEEIKEEEEELLPVDYVDVSQLVGEDARDAGRYDPLASDEIFNSAACQNFINNNSANRKNKLLFTSRRSANSKFILCELSSASPPEGRQICKSAKRHQKKQCGSSLKVEKTAFRRVWSCQFCEEKFLSSCSLGRHVLSHRRPTKASFVCDLCGACFSQEKDLASHRRIILDQQPFKCSHCNNAYTSICSLNLHLKSHGKVVPVNRDETCSSNLSSEVSEASFVCSVCSKSFPHGLALKLHQHMSYGESWICPHCSKICSGCCAMNRHLQSHSP